MLSLAARQWLKALVFAGLYLLSGYAIAAAGAPEAVQALWPPAGIALASFFILGARFWPAVALPAFALSYWLTPSLPLAFVAATAATLQGWAGAWLLRRLGFNREFKSLRHLLSLLLAALLSPLVSTAIRELWQLAFSPADTSHSWMHWRGDVTGIMVFLPLLLAFQTMPPLREWRARFLESLALFVLFAAGCGLVFGLPPGRPLGFLLVPFGVWGSLRFGLRTIVSLNLMVAVAGIAGTLRDLGQFGAGALPDRMLTFSAFMVIAALLNLTFFAMFAERTEAFNTRSRLVQILETTTDFVGTADYNGRVTFLNRAARQLMGMRPDQDIESLRVRDFHPPWVAELIQQEAIPEAIKNGYWQGETVLLTRDGREVPISQLILGHLSDGRVEFLSTVARDISLKKQREQQLKLSQETFAKAFRSTPDGITITSLAEGRYVDVNDAFLRATEFTRDEVIGRTTLELNVWHDRQERDQLLERLRVDGRVSGMDFHFRSRSGRTIVAVLSAEIIEVGGEKCLLSVIRDVTKSRLLEEQLRQSQKLEAVGRLAAGIAHDFNNLLLVIHGYSELQLDSLAPDDPSRRGVEEVKAAADRAAALTRQLLAFSRKQVLEPKVLDLNAILADVSTLLRRLIGAHVELQTILDPALGRVKADPSQVEQILINLAVNARDAMPHGGRITIETANVVLDSSFAETRPEIVPGKYVMVAVTDTGIGMDVETQAHIFEPFFTTKDRDKGTGLGLATVYGIVKQSSGYIYVYSEPEHGATFKVFLPLVEAELSDRTREASPDDVRGDETILLVEDEAAVRNLARDFLGLKGYKVLAAASGEEALELIQTHPGSIDLLLTDIVMPRIGGRQLATRLRAQWPGLQVLFISGYTDDTILRAGTLLEGEAFLQKPFALTALATRVREALGPQPAPEHPTI